MAGLNLGHLGNLGYLSKMKKERFLTIGLVLATVVLASLAVLTAWKIATRKPVAPTVPQKVPRAASPACRFSFSVLSPTPTPTGEVTPTGVLSPTPTGTLMPTQTPTSTPSPTLTPTITPTPTPLLGCYRECESDDDCEGTLRCQTVSGVKRCVNLSCPGEKDCICNVVCWEICGQESECPEELTCRSIDGTYRCVNPDCEREQDCECAVAEAPPPAGGFAPVPTGPTPTPVELPEAGISLPTIGAAIGGIILTIVSLLLAL